MLDELEKEIQERLRVKIKQQLFELEFGWLKGQLGNELQGLLKNVNED